MSQKVSTTTSNQMLSPHNVAVGKPYLERGRALSAIALSKQQFTPC